MSGRGRLSAHNQGTADMSYAILPRAPRQYNRLNEAKCSYGASALEAANERFELEVASRRGKPSYELPKNNDVAIITARATESYKFKAGPILKYAKEAQSAKNAHQAALNSAKDEATAILKALSNSKKTHDSVQMKKNELDLKKKRREICSLEDNIKIQDQKLEDYDNQLVAAKKTRDTRIKNARNAENRKMSKMSKRERAIANKRKADFLQVRTNHHSSLSDNEDKEGPDTVVDTGPEIEEPIDEASEIRKINIDLFGEDVTDLVAEPAFPEQLGFKSLEEEAKPKKKTKENKKSTSVVDVAAAKRPTSIKKAAVKPIKFASSKAVKKSTEKALLHALKGSKNTN